MWHLILIEFTTWHHQPGSSGLGSPSMIVGSEASVTLVDCLSIDATAGGPSVSRSPIWSVMGKETIAYPLQAKHLLFIHYGREWAHRNRKDEQRCFCRVLFHRFDDVEESRRSHRLRRLARAFQTHLIQSNVLKTCWNLQSATLVWKKTILLSYCVGFNQARIHVISQTDLA